MAGFEGFVCRAAAGNEPYRYQSRLAEERLPDVLRAPRGTGKASAAVLYRRLEHLMAEVWRTTLR